MYSIAIGRNEKAGRIIDVERTVLRYIDLEWTSEPPTQEGWYWAIKNREDEIHYPEVVNVRMNRFKTELIATLNDYETNFCLSDFIHWLGPLPEPEMPDKG